MSSQMGINYFILYEVGVFLVRLGFQFYILQQQALHFFILKHEIWIEDEGYQKNKTR